MVPKNTPFVPFLEESSNIHLPNDAIPSVQSQPLESFSNASVTGEKSRQATTAVKSLNDSQNEEFTVNMNLDEAKNLKSSVVNDNSKNGSEQNAAIAKRTNDSSVDIETKKPRKVTDDENDIKGNQVNASGNEELEQSLEELDPEDTAEFLVPGHICETCDNREFASARSLRNHKQSKLHKQALELQTEGETLDVISGQITNSSKNVTQVNDTQNRNKRIVNVAEVNEKPIYEENEALQQNFNKKPSFQKFICLDGIVYNFVTEKEYENRKYVNPKDFAYFQESLYVATRRENNSLIQLGIFSTIVKGMLYRISNDPMCKTQLYSFIHQGVCYTPEMDKYGSFIKFVNVDYISSSKAFDPLEHISFNGVIYEKMQKCKDNFRNNTKSVELMDEHYTEVKTDLGSTLRLKPSNTILFGILYQGSDNDYDMSGLRDHIINNKLYKPILGSDNKVINVGYKANHEPANYRDTENSLNHVTSALEVKNNIDVLSTLHSCNVFLCDNCLQMTQKQVLCKKISEGVEINVVEIHMCARCIYVNVGYSQTFNSPISFKQI